jgi:hypothetical protein
MAEIGDIHRSQSKRSLRQMIPMYQLLDRKRAEGKHYYSGNTAGFAEFLCIYYARVKWFSVVFYSEI